MISRSTVCWIFEITFTISHSIMWKYNLFFSNFFYYFHILLTSIDNTTFSNTNYNLFVQTVSLNILIKTYFWNLSQNIDSSVQLIMCISARKSLQSINQFQYHKKYRNTKTKSRWIISYVSISRTLLFVFGYFHGQIYRPIHCSYNLKIIKNDI